MELDEYEMIKTHVHKLLGIDLKFYKDEQMRRRLDSWLARSGTAGWDDYFQRVQVNLDEKKKFRNYLTINVTEFFRDFERWSYMKDNVLPELLSQIPRNRAMGTGLRVWSAGCSTGAEAYSLSIFLDELAPTKQHYILATDLDQGALERASAGGPYIQEDIKNVPDKIIEQYFVENEANKYFIKDKFIKKIVFREQNLLNDHFELDFDLIVCRNVVIYFKGEIKDALYKKFLLSLRPGGMLFVGGTEIIPRPQEIGFKNFGVSFYTRLF